MDAAPRPVSYVEPDESLTTPHEHHTTFPAHSVLPDLLDHAGRHVR